MIKFYGTIDAGKGCYHSGYINVVLGLAYNTETHHWHVGLITGVMDDFEEFDTYHIPLTDETIMDYIRQDFGDFTFKCCSYKEACMKERKRIKDEMGDTFVWKLETDEGTEYIEFDFTRRVEQLDNYINNTEQ